MTLLPNLVTRRKIRVVALTTEVQISHCLHVLCTINFRIARAKAKESGICRINYVEV